MKRAKHTLSHYRMVTGNMGQIMPISCIPVLPGDTVQMSTDLLIRLSPLNTPVMHPTQIRVHHFFVPNRLTWDEWEDFITGGPDGTSAPTIPTFQSTANKKDLQCYLGMPALAGNTIIELPVRAANMIFNEYYRDQDLVAARAEDDLSVMNCAWEKDYFTTARPWTQKGAAVTVPLGDQAPIFTDATGAGVDVKIDAPNQAGGKARFDHTATTFTEYINDTGTGNNLFADLSAATGTDVNDLRAAFSLQRYQEARARYGSRFTEYLRYLGVRPSDARLQRPEYLGGGTGRLQFSEVLQTAPDATSGTSGTNGVGDLYGHGIAGVRSNRFRKFFEEHGYIISMLSIRPKSLYVNGVYRDWIKETKEDYYQKELVNLGQQEVYTTELSAQNNRNVFGYQDRYHEYRSHPSQISGDFIDTIDAYHMGRKLAGGVTLNEDFVKCEPDGRIFQVDPATADSVWVAANNHVVARRLVPKRANPRIL
jgi:hypothetical protein